jgi:predicted PurR-regulated permease PerM
MAVRREMKTMVGLIAAVVLLGAAYSISTVLAPLALALFIIAIVWPLHKWLKSWMPTLLALAISIVVTVTVCLVFASLVGWGFSRVARWLVADSARYQAWYEGAVAWLDGHGISIASVWAEHFNMAWLLRILQQVTGRVNTAMTFCLIAFVYVVLGLLEVDSIRLKINMLGNREAARVLLDGSKATAAKFRKYLLVRTLMSLMTGLLVGVFAWGAGLPFAPEWGVIAFALNYIPFIGPFIATVFPTMVAMTQFETWQAVLGVFVCLNIIQFVVGSYVEPRVSGNMLSISPIVVLFSVFFWTFLWGLFGAFIGVPIMLAILTFCDQHPSSRWMAGLLR